MRRDACHNRSFEESPSFARLQPIAKPHATRSFGLVERSGPDRKAGVFLCHFFLKSRFYMPQLCSVALNVFRLPCEKIRGFGHETAFWHEIRPLPRKRTFSCSKSPGRRNRCPSKCGKSCQNAVWWPFSGRFWPRNRALARTDLRRSASENRDLAFCRKFPSRGSRTSLFRARTRFRGQKSRSRQHGRACSAKKAKRAKGAKAAMHQPRPRAQRYEVLQEHAGVHENVPQEDSQEALSERLASGSRSPTPSSQDPPAPRRPPTGRSG